MQNNIAKAMLLGQKVENTYNSSLHRQTMRNIEEKSLILHKYIYTPHT